MPLIRRSTVTGTCDAFGARRNARSLTEPRRNLTSDGVEATRHVAAALGRRLPFPFSTGRCGVKAAPAEGGPKPTFTTWLFLEVSRGGHLKGKNPGVKTDDLRAKWIYGAAIAYIGKADNMQRRLREFCRFGAGAAIGHWGGRYLWWVADSDEWLVCWKACDEGETALEAEAALLDGFAEAHGGQLLFANLRR